MKISLTIPTYNRASLVVETLQSVLRQTRQPDELIVVDDGSTDDTREVLNIYADRIAYYYQPNAGLAAARNAGLAHSHGDCMCFLDSDDLLLPTALERLEQCLNSAPEAALVFCRAELLYEDGTTHHDLLWDRALALQGDIWYHLVRAPVIRSAGTALIRRSCLEHVGGWDASTQLEDQELWVRLAEVAPFVTVPETLYQYRLHSGPTLTGPPDDAAWFHARVGFYKVLMPRYQPHPHRLHAVLSAHRALHDRAMKSLIRRTLDALSNRHTMNALQDFILLSRLCLRYASNRELLTTFMPSRSPSPFWYFKSNHYP